jgi:hypothetical protein
VRSAHVGQTIYWKSGSPPFEVVYVSRQDVAVIWRVDGKLQVHAGHLACFTARRDAFVRKWEEANRGWESSRATRIEQRRKRRSLFLRCETRSR